MSIRGTYIARMKLQLEELNATLSEMEAKENERNKYKAEMSKLRQHSQRAGDKLDELMAAGEDVPGMPATPKENVRSIYPFFSVM